MSNFIDNAGKNGNGTLMPQTFIEEPITPQGEGVHRGLPQGVQRAPASRRRSRPPRATTRSTLRRRREAGGHRPTRKKIARRARGPEGAGGRRHRHLEEAVLEVGPGRTSTTHEAFRREQVVMGMVKDGRVVFANEADRARLAKRRQAVGARKEGLAALRTCRELRPCPRDHAQMAVSGALMGLVYALIAYGFQLTYATSKSINFGQGELVMVSAFVSLTLLDLGPALLARGAARAPLRRAARARGGARGGAARARAEERGLDPAHHHRRPVPLLGRREHLGPRRPARSRPRSRPTRSTCSAWTSPRSSCRWPSASSR